MDTPLRSFYIPKFRFFALLGVHSAGARELEAPKYNCEAPCLIFKRKTAVHFHTQYALCTRIRVRMYIHTGQTQ